MAALLKVRINTNIMSSIRTSSDITKQQYQPSCLFVCVLFTCLCVVARPLGQLQTCSDSRSDLWPLAAAVFKEVPSLFGLFINTELSVYSLYQSPYTVQTTHTHTHTYTHTHTHTQQWTVDLCIYLPDICLQNRTLQTHMHTAWVCRWTGQTHRTWTWICDLSVRLKQTNVHTPTDLPVTRPKICHSDTPTDRPQ